MKGVLVTCLLLFLLQFACAAEEKSVARFEKLVKDSQNQTPIKLDTSKLKLHASSAHNYSLIVLFTTNDPKIKCQMCPFVEKEFKETVKEFYSLFGRQVSSSPKFLQNPFFFGTCDVQDCYEILVQAEWNSVPKIIYIPPKSEKGSIDYKEWKELQMAELPNPEMISQFIAQNTHFPFVVEKSVGESMGMYAVALFGLAFFLYTVYSKFKNPMFWFTITMGIFAVSMAGLVFNSINKPPFNYRHPYTQQVHFIYPNSRQQFQIEGLIMAGLLSGISLTIVGFVHYVPSLKGGLKKRFAFAVLSLIFGIFYVIIWRIFKMKHPYYPF